MPLLKRTASIPQSDVRVILVSSHGHMYAPKPQGIRYETLRTTDSLGSYERYGQSKPAMILWAKEAARRNPLVTVVSVHPGVVRTNLMDNATGSPCWVKLLGKVANKVVTSVAQGVRNQLWATVSADVVSGCYYEPVGTGGLETVTEKDDNLARGLWEWTEGEIREYLG
jgi:NAD(P)-dependent dehydrogenase (short-subunit alcohol dehydrogenase family)